MTKEVKCTECGSIYEEGNCFSEWNHIIKNHTTKNDIERNKDHRRCIKCGILLVCRRANINLDTEGICEDKRVCDSHIPGYEECNCEVQIYG